VELEEAMASRLPHDISLFQAVDRKHLLESNERVTKSKRALEQMQARISKTVALIQEVQAKWPTNVPTLPKPIGTSPRAENVSGSSSG
jgi:hypothetical protein